VLHRDGGCPAVTKVVSSPSLRIQRVNIAGAEMICNVSSGAVRPVVPATFQRTVFAAVHGLAPPGIKATPRMISRRFVWHRCAADVSRWCRDYQECQHDKVTKLLATATLAIPVPEKRFSHLHVDLVGLLPTSPDGFKYMFTIIDRSTRWLEPVPVKNMEATTAADALVAGWICRFEVPAAITSDHSTQFTSAVWEALCTQLGIKHITTTAFHPCSNGIVERAHRQLKDALRARQSANDWPENLPWVLLGLRAAPNEDSSVSSAELVLGEALVLPSHQSDTGQLPPPPGRSYRDVLVSPTPRHIPTRPLPPAAEEKGLPAALQRCQAVYIYAGPYQVVERRPKTFTVLVGDKSEVVSVDQLKPHIGHWKLPTLL
jgi:transposase InsO family protein